VSYPAPTYYSHLAVDRARKHHDQLLEENLGKKRAKHIIDYLMSHDQENYYFNF
jgi:hypothetical protein